jgi:hypothetical protein
MSGRDLLNNINVLPLFPPIAAVTDNTAQVSNIIDRAGYESVVLALNTGTLTDVDATFAVTMEHGDNSALSDTAAPVAGDLIGTTALASFTFASDNKTLKLGYMGLKRYLRMTVTPTNNTGNLFLSGVAILGNPHIAPTVNPPA